MPRVTLKEEIKEEVEHLYAKDLKKVRSYIHFLKLNTFIEPSQLYFWTQRWQQMEAQAESNKRAGRMLGNGTPKGLLKALKSES